MNDRYEFRQIEAKWQRAWEEEGIYHVDPHETKPKYYALEMFPTPQASFMWGIQGIMQSEMRLPGSEG